MNIKELHPSNDDGQRGGSIFRAELALADGRDASSGGGSSPGECTGHGAYDEPPCSQAWTREGDKPLCRHTPVKQVEDSD